jgi:putative ABC transport system permease protein
MRISTIALANLKRRKGKALFLSVGIAIGIGTVVALLTLTQSIQEEIGAQMDRYGANILVLPQSNSLALDYGGISVSGVSFDMQELKDEDARRIREIPYRQRLSVIAPKLLSAVDVDGHQVLLAGVDFASELRLKRWWQVVGQKPAAEDQVLIGYEVARTVGIVTADMAAPVDSSDPGHHEAEAPARFNVSRNQVRVAGREHQVAGVLAQTGGPEDCMVFATLTRVQDLVNKPGRLSLIEVSALCIDCPVDDIVAQIQAKLPHAKVSAIQQAVKARTETVERLTRFSAAVSIVVLAIGALMIFTTMMSSVIERTREIGVFRAIGFRRVHIVKGLVIEIAVVSAAGGALGYLAGMAVSWAALPFFTEGGAQLKMTPETILFSLAVALVIGLASTVYPAFRASRLDPSEAIRQL